MKPKVDWIPRWRCVQALDQVLNRGSSLTSALNEATAGLAQRDAAWVQALAYTTLRWYPRLDAWVDSMLERPIPARDAVIRVLICQGLAELFYFGTPDHAAVRETAELARSLQRPGMVGLINAVLRRALRERDWLEQQATRLPSARYACPPWLLAAIRQSWPQHWTAILEASTQPPPMTLRVNLHQHTRDDYLQRLAAAGIAAEAHPDVPSAITLQTAVDVSALPGFAAGACSVQDAAAQWAAQLLQPQAGERVLDACAAPGGKTGHLLEYAQGALDLVAVDIDGQRCGQVRDNLQRLGYRAQVCIGDLQDPEPWWDGNPFDRILLDVPCSATGVIRRHPDIKYLRRSSDVVRLAERQRALLNQAWGLLRPGGQLLYATCSLLKTENEDVVAPWLADHPEASLPELHLPVGQARAVGWSIPLGEAGMDGFYYALCLKN